ncbi:membrane protein [Bacteroidia bacterium]|nr:membrane protein [Bacteroidia bacterium]
MKLKNIVRSVLGVILIFATVSCSLDYDPISDYSDVTEGYSEDGQEVVFKDKAAVETQLQVLYTELRNQDWYIDATLIAESHADNAYAGAFNAEVGPFEDNSIDGTNTVLERDWNRYLSQVGMANKLIIYADSVADNSLSDTEIKRYQAQGMIFRSLILFDMARLWGNIPLVTVIAPNITSENFDEIYPLYFPSQTPEIDVYKQLESDLLFAIQHAPDINPSDKTLMSKTVARALLAKVYAEKPIRDYDKVVKYCDEVAADGVDLVDDFTLLFGMNDKVTDIKARNTKESILEAHFVAGNGNWCYMMFGRDLLNWDANFSWNKWVTPSRDLIKLYETEGDTKRYEESIVYYECGWSLYYPNDNYPFMYKCRSSQSSIIYLRYAELMLLKAEALLMKSSPDLNAAASIIDRIRSRAGLQGLPANIKANKESLFDALMKERRMELAFEGERWFELVRLDLVEKVMNAVYAKDSGRVPVKWNFSQASYRLPIPLSVIDNNPNIVQNEGY